MDAPRFAAPSSAADDPAWDGALRLTFDEGEEIYAQGEEADLVYRVIRGAVRTSHLLADGRRQVGEFYYAGDLFGLELSKTHRFSAEALNRCEIETVRRRGGDGSTESPWDRVTWAAAQSELARAHAHMLLLGKTTAAEKVARFLLNLHDRDQDETVLPMNRQDMADYLGLTIETVSRTLSRFQASGLVRFNNTRRFTVLRPASLAANAAF